MRRQAKNDYREVITVAMKHSLRSPKQAKKRLDGRKKGTYQVQNTTCTAPQHQYAPLHARRQSSLNGKAVVYTAD